MISGEMETTVGDEKFIAKKDDIVFVNKCYSHSYKMKGNYKNMLLLSRQECVMTLMYLTIVYFQLF